MREARDDERFRRPHFEGRVGAEPGARLVRQHADDRVRGPVERDAPPDHVRIAAQPLSPERLGDERDIGLVFFLRTKPAAADRTDAEEVEVAPRQLSTEHLDGIAKPGQRERG